MRANLLDRHRKSWVEVRTTLATIAIVVPFALVPVRLAFMAHAQVQVPEPWIVARASLGCVVAATILTGAVIMLGASARVAGTAVAAGLFLIGHYPLVQRFVFVDVSSGIAASVGLAYLCACAAVIVAVTLKRPAQRSAFSDVTDVASVVLAVIMIWQLWQGYQQHELDLGDRPPIPGTASTRSRPDIYHIVLDGFGRSDVLSSLYGLDLSWYLDRLTRIGFRVSPDGFANYAQTYLSLASMLDAQYVQESVDLAKYGSSRALPHTLINSSRVISVLKQLGYRFHLIGSAFGATRKHDLANECECSIPIIGEFESLVIRTTPFWETGLFGLDYKPHRRKIQRTFEALETLAATGPPRFVLAHVLAPHPPFVFDAKGSPVAPRRAFSLGDGPFFAGTVDEYVRGYREQATHVAERVLGIVEDIVRDSAAAGRDSVIVLHGDHGPRGLFTTSREPQSDARESLPVFLAIRWPASTRHVSVESLVNVYRVLFNVLFDQDLDVLPDRAFTSSFSAPYEFVEIDPASLRR